MPFVLRRAEEAMAKKVTRSQLAILEQEREQTQKELENLRAELRAEIEHDDIDDVASDLVERDKTYALIMTLERRLENIEHAVEQAHEGGYGICEDCGITIDPERLEIFPEATLCVDCKRKSERFGRGNAY
jgi:DnaK suppressor protein